MYATPATTTPSAPPARWQTLTERWAALLEEEPRPRIRNAAEKLGQQLSSPRLEDGAGQRGRVALFAQDEWRSGGKRPISLVGGMRGDLDSSFGGQVSPKAALRWDIAQATSLRASYGRGFRVPDFREQLFFFQNPGVGYLDRGNPDLRAERSHGVQAGSARACSTRPWGWSSATSAMTSIN